MNMKHKPLMELRIKCGNQVLIHVIYKFTLKTTAWAPKTRGTEQLTSRNRKRALRKSTHKIKIQIFLPWYLRIFTEFVSRWNIEINYLGWLFILTYKGNRAWKVYFPASRGLFSLVTSWEDRTNRERVSFPPECSASYKGNEAAASWVKVCYTQVISVFIDVVLFSFSFFVLFDNIGELASEASARERARSARKKKIFSSSSTTPLCWWSIKSPWFTFTRARRTLKRK